MKKIEEISIGKHSFPVEERACQKLTRYLELFQQKLGKDSQSDEIMEDIEERVAELFEARLHSPRQVVTLSLINAVIEQLGLPDGSTFHDDEVPPDPASDSADTPPCNEFSFKHFNDYFRAGNRQFCRDTKQKKIAGVCSGLSRHFGYELSVVRLLFLLSVVLLLLGLSKTNSSFNLYHWSSYSVNNTSPHWLDATFYFYWVGQLFYHLFILVGNVGFWGYLILWVATPAECGDERLLKDSVIRGKERKLFRDPGDKKIGGVCSGLSLYLGTDVTIVRVVALLLLLCASFGFWLYLILWFATPLARSAADKCLMRGWSITAENLKKFY